MLAIASAASASVRSSRTTTSKGSRVWSRISTEEPSGAGRIVRRSAPRTLIGLVAFESAQGHELVAEALDAPPPPEVGEVDHDGRADDLAPHRLDDADRGLERPAGRDEIVDQEHLLAARDRVGVHLDAVAPVLERVHLADRRVRELPGL